MWPQEHCSKETLRSCWHTRWRFFLKVRGKSQHGRCPTCAELTQERKNARTPEDRAGIAKRKADHIEAVLAIRVASVRTTRMAEHDAKHPAASGEGQLLKIFIDGMDQTKLKCPRHVSNSKFFSDKWRPQLHLVGCIVPGHYESFYIMDQDIAKDSNMNCTIIAKQLDLVHADLTSNGYAVPHNICIAADNTARETKNQHFLTMQDFIVSSDAAESWQTEYLPMGHSHNEQDQRFGVAATVFARSDTRLETPAEFATVLREKFKPVRGRKLHVEVSAVKYYPTNLPTSPPPIFGLGTLNCSDLLKRPQTFSFVLDLPSRIMGGIRWGSTCCTLARSLVKRLTSRSSSPLSTYRQQGWPPHTSSRM